MSTNIIADYAIFSIYGENVDGTIYLKVLDFANECIYNTEIQKEEIEDTLGTLITAEVFDESNRLCGFRLPNGTTIEIEYNDFGMPTKISNSMGNVKEVEYYDSKCIKSMISYYAPTGMVFWRYEFEDQEMPLHYGGGELNE